MECSNESRHGVRAAALVCTISKEPSYGIRADTVIMREMAPGANGFFNIIPPLYESHIVSVHRMVMENRPVDPGSIQGSHRPVSFIRIKRRTRADDILCKTEY